MLPPAHLLKNRHSAAPTYISIWTWIGGSERTSRVDAKYTLMFTFLSFLETYKHKLKLNEIDKRTNLLLFGCIIHVKETTF